MNSSPWLSVVVPIYNAEQHLKKCVESVLRQNFADFELLLVDDGSTDKTSDLCREFALTDKRVLYLRKENGGPYQSRIYGAEHARGDYITFCDADDYYARKDAFEKIKQYVDQYDPDLLQFSFRVKYNHLSKAHKGSKQPLIIDRETFLKDEYPLFLCSFYDGAHLTHNVWNKVYKRSLLSALPSSENAERLFWGEDLVLNLEVLKECTSIIIVPEVLYTYKDATGGTTRFSKNAMLDVNIIKDHQLTALSKTAVQNKEDLLSTIHSETACWLWTWVKEGLQIVDETELVNFVEEAITLPRINEAREYYLYKNPLDWEAMDLLRQGNSQRYIDVLKKVRKSKKASIMGFLKNLYKTL